MKLSLSLLPAYLQHSMDDNLDPSDKRKTKNNEKSIRNILGSSMHAMSSASNETKADAMARGKTAQILWFDEIAFLFFNKAIVEAAIPAFNKAAERAQVYGMPFGMHITTTPGDLGSAHGAYAYKFMQDSIKFKETMYDEKPKKVIRMVNNSKDKMAFLFIQFSYLELGYDDDWLYRNTKSLDRVKARREYLLEWINTNGNSPFETDDVELIADLALERAKIARDVKINKHFSMTVYGEYRGKLPVVISVDVSQGLGRDSSAIVVIHPETMQPMAIFKSNKISQPDLKRVIVKLIVEHYPNSILTVENNSIGGPLIEELKETVVKRNLYREKRTKTVESGSGTRDASKRRKVEMLYYGHNVNATTRPQMTNLLETLVSYNRSLLGYPELSDEIKFMEYRNGRIQHSSNTHDDVTFAYLGGLHIIQHGKNMAGRGIRLNIATTEDECVEFLYDVSQNIKNFGRTIRKNTRYSEDDEERYWEETYNYITESKGIRTSDDLIRAQREEMQRMRDIIDGDSDLMEESMTMRFSDDVNDKIFGKSTADFGLSNLLNANRSLRGRDEDSYSISDMLKFK
jgi:hypothetical protein